MLNILLDHINSIQQSPFYLYRQSTFCIIFVRHLAHKNKRIKFILSCGGGIYVLNTRYVRVYTSKTELSTLYDSPAEENNSKKKI